MPEKSRLMPISYYNPKQEIRLSAYADTIVLEPDGREQRLRAIRFGGYSEMVRAMSDAIYAGATLETEFAGEPAILACEPKKYECHLSHDGIYAEATILSLDDADETRSTNEEEMGGQTNVELPPRKCILFCPAGDRQALFEALDRKTAVPLISEFQDYVLDELQRRGILRPLRVISIRERLEAWLLLCKKDDANIVKVLEEGLKTGAIRIPGAVQNPNGFESVHSVTSYLYAFGVTVAERIRNQFQPLFDPAAEQLSPEILRINDHIRAHAGYSLYPAQLAVAESVKRKLSEGKSAFIVAECGSGKTKIGATALAAYQAQKRKKTFNIILCPSHVAKKWVREIAETLPDTAGVIVRSITELDSLYAQYRQGDKSIYAVISKEKARDGYMRRPAVLFDARKGAFRCPGCGSIIELPSSDDTYDWVTAKPEAFRMENRRNHQCMNCGEPLWTAVNPSVPSPWVKIPEYGWVHRKLAVHAMQKTKNPAALDALQTLRENPDGYFPTRGACRRYPLSSYIKKRYRGRLDGLIVDELHEYNNDSGQGDAMAELFGTAKKVIGMTATLINGYSSGIFHLLYRTSAQLMLADGKSHEKPALFNTEYGVVETTYTEADESYAAKRRSQKSGVRTRQLPGVSPLVFSRFLLEKTAFLSLSDMGKALPSYEEIPIACRMDEAVQSEYKRIENALVRVLRSDRRVAKKILSAYLNLLTVYPDQPYDQKPIFYPDSDVPIVEPENIGDADTLGEKELRTLEIVKAAIQNGERALIYTSWVRTDSQQKLKKLLTDEGYLELTAKSNVYKLPLQPSSPNTTSREPYALEQRHAAYSEMLSLLTLSDRHRDNLHERGLPDAIIERNGYKSMPETESERRLLASLLRCDHELHGLPGFYTKDGTWTLAGANGFLIPVRNKDGLIQGMKIRLDDNAARKYRWLSSRSSRMENGARSYSWIHVTGDTTQKRAYLTEGPLKGDIASYFANDALFVCLGGVNAHKGLRETLLSLGVTEVMEAMDMDQFTNPQVRQAIITLRREVQSIPGIRYYQCTWNPRFKGVDDYLLDWTKRKTA